MFCKFIQIGEIVKEVNNYSMEEICDGGVLMTKPIRSIYRVASILYSLFPELIPNIL